LRAEELCKLLAGLELLEPFTMKADVEGFTMQLKACTALRKVRWIRSRMTSCASCSSQACWKKSIRTCCRWTTSGAC